MTKSSDDKKSKKRKEEIYFTNITPDDIAKRFLETPPKPKTINKRVKE